MKKLLMIAGALLFCAWNAHSEVVETVGYNPTRYGQYKRLKISSGVEFPKGLVSPKAEAPGGGSVTLEACQDGCTNPAYKIDYLKAETVQGNNTAFDVQTINVNKGNITLYQGGEISSAIGAGNVLAGQLEATSSNLVVSNRLTLGKGVIAPPAGRTDCQWQWENVAHKDGTAKVLALKGCAGGSTPNPEPDPEPTPDPVATCDQRDYLVAHKAECCPAEASSNTDCWTWDGTWGNVQYNGSGCGWEYGDGRPVVNNYTCPASAESVLEYNYVFLSYGQQKKPDPACPTEGATCTINLRCNVGQDPITFTCIGEYKKNGW